MIIESYVHFWTLCNALINIILEHPVVFPYLIAMIVTFYKQFVCHIIALIAPKRILYLHLAFF